MANKLKPKLESELQLELREQLKTMTITAFRPCEFTIEIDPSRDSSREPCIFKYSCGLFSCHISHTRNEKYLLTLYTKYSIPGLYIKKIFGNKDPKSSEYSFKLLPSNVSENKIHYKSDGQLPEEWCRMILSFSPGQDERSFSYPPFNQNNFNNIKWMSTLNTNIDNTPGSVIQTIAQECDMQFNKEEAYIYIKTPNWHTYFDNLSAIATEVVDYLNKLDNLSMMPCDLQYNTENYMDFWRNEGKYHDYFFPAAKAEGGLAINKLFFASHAHYLDTEIVHECVIRGHNKYNSCKSDQTNISMYTLFNELLRKNGILTEFKINGKTINNDNYTENVWVNVRKVMSSFL